MVTMFMVCAGICWTAAYVLIIRAGVKDRTYGMPVVAFASNISWEFLFSIVRPPSGVQHAIDLAWLGLDLGIGYTIVRFGPREFRYLDRATFYAALLVLIISTYIGVNLFCSEFDGGNGVFAAFGSNLMMSGLFLSMIAARGSSRGQSVGIAVTKMAGTTFVALALTLLPGKAARYHDAILPYLYVSIFVLDLAYVIAVARVSRRERAEAERHRAGQLSRT